MGTTAAIILIASAAIATIIGLIVVIYSIINMEKIGAKKAKRSAIIFTIMMAISVVMCVIFTLFH